MRTLLNLLLAIVAFWVTGAVCGLLGIPETIALVVSLLVAVWVFFKNFAARFGD